jgi:hypothetical protein
MFSFAISKYMYGDKFCRCQVETPLALSAFSIMDLVRVMNAANCINTNLLNRRFEQTTLSERFSQKLSSRGGWENI